MLVDEIVGENIRFIRSLCGLSQRALGDLVADFGLPRLTQGEVSKIEHGRRTLSVEGLCAFALVLHVSPLHLLVPVREGVVVKLFGEGHALPLTREQWRDWLGGGPTMDLLGASPPNVIDSDEDGRPIVGNPPGADELDRVYAQATAAHRDGLLARRGPRVGDERDALLLQLARKLVAQEGEA